MEAAIDIVLSATVMRENFEGSLTSKITICFRASRTATWVPSGLMHADSGLFTSNRQSGVSDKAVKASRMDF